MAIVAILEHDRLPGLHGETWRAAGAPTPRPCCSRRRSGLERQYTVSQVVREDGRRQPPIGEVPYTEASDVQGGNKAYTVSFAASSATGYTLQAVPKNNYGERQSAARSS